MKKMFLPALLALAFGMGCTNFRRSLVTNPGSMRSMSAFTLGVPESAVKVENDQLSEHEARWDVRLSNGTIINFKSDPFLNGLTFTTNKTSASISPPISSSIAATSSRSP